MSKPANAQAPKESEANPPASQEELDVVRERMRTFDEDRKVARPAEEVLDRLLRRCPNP